jgi:hypothetical protein
MTLRLRHDRPINRNQDGWNLDENPCIAIAADGMGAIGSYWIENDGHADPLTRRHE